MDVEIENQTLNCKISGEHQIKTLRCVGHLRPGWTFEPRPKWPMEGLLRLTQLAIGHLRPARKIRRPSETSAICVQCNVFITYAIHLRNLLVVGHVMNIKLYVFWSSCKTVFILYYFNLFP